jgi:biotin carboxyl carrier protein
VIYEVDINGRTRQVEITRVRQRYVVVVDGRRHSADVTVIGQVWSLLLSAAADGGAAPRRSFEIAMVEQPPGSGSLNVHVNGRLIAAAVGAARGSWARRGHEARPGEAGPYRIAAPMPGKVVKVLVNPGDRVAAQQGVVVVEAMKMENELRAARAGTVAAVHVAEGSLVEAGTALMVIE